MRAGRLDRRITIQKNEPTQDGFGEETDNWTNVAPNIPAQVMPESGRERFQAQQIIGRAVVTFRIRYRPDVTVKNRILYNGRTYDIHDVREIGRRVGLDIDASARSEDEVDS